MPHTEEHKYILFGTTTPYAGKVVEIGGELFTTNGGGFEGGSQKITEIGGKSNSTNNTMNTLNASVLSDNPVTRNFVSRVSYYTADGTEIPRGSNLHQHADGTIMTEHVPEGSVMSDTSIVVTTTFNNNNQNTITRQSQTQTTQARNLTRGAASRSGVASTRTPRSGGGTMGGGSGGRGGGRY
tara:strand:- start:443 stop:991 length:549 start_codon:yes stop_codon:yes gene_type:complete